MKAHKFTCLVLIGLYLVVLCGRGNAQAILTTTFTPTAVCPGQSITVIFSTTGTFGNGNVFTAQLSDATGNFSVAPTSIGTSSTGATIFALMPNPLAAGSGYRIRVASSNPAQSATSALTLTVKAAPGAPGVIPATYCAGQGATALTAAPLTGATLNWYGQNSSGGTASSIAPTPPTATTGSTAYYVSQTANGCESARAKLDVTTKAIPAIPTVTAPAPYCEGVSAVPLSASGQNLKWYGTDATGGSGVTTPSIPATTKAGTTNYYVSQTVTGCESARTSIPVVVKPKPAFPTTAASIPAYCQNQTAGALSATALMGATLNWYGTNLTGGTPSSTPTVPSTNQAGTVNYYVSQTLNGCEGARAAIAVTVKPTPGGPMVASPFIICQNRPVAPLTATPSTGASLIWYGTSAVGGTATATAPMPSTVTLGSTTYYVSQLVSGCEGPRSALTVTVNAIPAPPVVTAPAAYCEGRAATPLTANGQNLTWYGTSATGGTASTTPTIPNTGANAIGSTPYYVSQTISGCESERALIAVQVNDTPDAPGTSAVEFCQGTSAPTLSVKLVANATPNWYGTNATGGPASGTIPVPANTTAGTTVYYVSQSLQGCESPRSGLSVRVKPLPVAPTVSAVSLCAAGSASPLTASGTNLNWYNATDQLLTGSPTPNTGTAGSQVFKVSQTVDNCEGPKANLTVVVNPLPAPPGISNSTYCQAQPDQPSQNVVPLTASGQNLRWYSASGNLLATAPTPVIDRTGTQVYQVSQTVNNCEGPKASLQITVGSAATPTILKPLLTYCLNDKSVPLQATGEAGSKLQWIDPYGRITNEAPTPPTLNTNVKPEGDAYYVYQISQAGCYSARAAIRIIVNSPPTLALVAQLTNVNLGQRIPLSLKFTGSGPYSYTISDGTSGRSGQSDTTISVLPRGNTTYQVAGVSNACGVGLPGNPATAAVTVRVPTISTSTLPASVLCAGSSLAVPFSTTGQFNSGNSFRFELVSSADTTRKYTVAESANNSPVTGIVPATLPSGQYFVRVRANNPEIGITGSNSPTLLTVRSRPTATLAGTQQIQEGVPTNLTITFGGDGPWTAVYADSTRNYSLTTSTNPYLLEVRPARTTTYRLLSITNSCGTGTPNGLATVTVIPLLSVDDHSLDSFVKTYPIPTTAALTVELNLPLNQQSAQLFLTDANGRIILSQTTRARQYSLDLTSQPSGFYVLRIQVGDRQTIRRLIKQ